MCLGVWVYEHAHTEYILSGMYTRTRNHNACIRQTMTINIERINCGGLWIYVGGGRQVRTYCPGGDRLVCKHDS